MEMSSDIESVHNIMQKQLDVVLRVGNVGKFMALDLIDRISAVGAALSSNLDRMTVQERNKYKDFLITELNKLEGKENSKENSKEKVSIE